MHLHSNPKNQVQGNFISQTWDANRRGQARRFEDSWLWLIATSGAIFVLLIMRIIDFSESTNQNAGPIRPDFSAAIYAQYEQYCPKKR
jgi:hypothetical protein